MYRKIQYDRNFKKFLFFYELNKTGTPLHTVQGNASHPCLNKCMTSAKAARPTVREETGS